MANLSKIDDKSMSIEWWADKLYEVYGDRMKIRKPEEFWMNVLAHISGIGESIRRTSYDDLLYHAAHALSWMICYIKKCNLEKDGFFRLKNNLTEIVGLKYPAECGHCQSKPCQCDPIRMDKLEDKAAHYEKLYESWQVCIKNSDYNINNWVGIFGKIYGGRIHLQTLENIGFHLLEEGGEEARAVRQLVRFREELPKTKGKKKAIIDETFLSEIDNIPGLINVYKRASKEVKKIDIKSPAGEDKKQIDFKDASADQLKCRIAIVKMDLIIEFADTFSWFVGVLLKLKEILENLKFYDKFKLDYDLENILKKEYMFNGEFESLSCSFCKKIPCKCVYV